MKVPELRLVTPRAVAALLLVCLLAFATALAAGPAASRLRTWQAERNERQAAGLLLAGQVDSARAVLRKALRRDPWRLEARRMLGQLELEHRRLEHAFLEYQTLVEIAPQATSGWRGLAQVWLAAGMPWSAEVAATRAIDLAAAAAEPDAAPDYLLRARIRAALGRRHSAQLDLRRARTLAPHDVAALTLDGEFGLLRPAIGPGGPAPRERFWPGRLATDAAGVVQALQRNDAASAAVLVDAARRDFPDTMYGPWLAGVVASAQGRLPEAEVQLRAALVHAPRSSRVATQLAHVWARRHGALEAGDRLLGLQDEDPGFLVPLDIAATAFLEARVPARAGEALARATVGDAAPAEAFRLLAEHYRGLDRLAEALQANAEGRERDPQDARLALQQAELQLAAGERKLARASLEHELKVRPDSLGPRLALARLLATDAPRSDAARELARTLSQDALEDPEAQDALGWLLARRGENAAAVPWLAAAASGAPQNPSIRYHHGAALLAQGRRDAGRAELAAALAGGATFAERPEAQKMLNAAR